MATSSVPLRPLAAVLAELASACPPADPRIVPTAEAVAGVLAEPVLVPAPVPAQARALRPGYAVSSRDLVGVSSYSPLLAIEPLHRVEAGDPLPPGADAVLPPDAANDSGPMTEIVGTVGPGENALRPGEDAAAGQVLSREGQVLSALTAAAALAAGIAQVAVRRARLRVVSVGPEAPWIAPVLSRTFAGFDVAFVSDATAHPDWSRLLDDPAATLTLLVADTPPSPEDAAGPAGRVIATGLALRPGETAFVVLRQERPLIVAPRRLDALVAVLHSLVAPLVALATGQTPPAVWRAAPLTRKLTSTIGLTEIALVRETTGGLEPLGLGRLSLAMLAEADGWFAIPPESEGLQAGERVEAFRLR